MKRKSIFKWILRGIGILILVIILFSVFQIFRPVHLQKLSLTTLEGRPVSIDSLIAGKRTLFNFWATWCKPCIAEMPMLDSVYQRLDKDKYQIIMISDEPAETIGTFLSRRSFLMPFLRSDIALSELGVAALPKTIIVDEEMKVLYKKTGEMVMGVEEMVKMLKMLE